MTRILSFVVATLGLIASGCGDASLDKVKAATKPTSHLSNMGSTCGPNMMVKLPTAGK
jgi:hypothetical protein